MVFVSENRILRINRLDVLNKSDEQSLLTETCSIHLQLIMTSLRHEQYCIVFYDRYRLRPKHAEQIYPPIEIIVFFQLHA